MSADGPRFLSHTVDLGLYAERSRAWSALFYLLRLLQCCPEVPTGQAQMTVLTDSWHRPPFMHGLGSQDTLSENTRIIDTRPLFRRSTIPKVRV